jgi:tRNA-dihydrouridine synthase
MLEYTKCDAVMIGRAALGNPWIFREINAYLESGEIIERPSKNEIRDMMIQHMESLVELKGEHVAILEMRSHGPWYLKGMDHASDLRRKLSQTKTKEEFIEHIDHFFNH